MSKKKLYDYEFSVLEMVHYEISVEAENYEKACDIAQSKIGEAKYVTSAKTEYFDCTYDEKQKLEEEEEEDLINERKDNNE
tara:strand:- start:2524 stop:2766 length:243 start_codon:yes stop_codon:yes gene_type:complete